MSRKVDKAMEVRGETVCPASDSPLCRLCKPPDEGKKARSGNSTGKFDSRPFKNPRSGNSLW